MELAQKLGVYAVYNISLHDTTNYEQQTNLLKYFIQSATRQMMNDAKQDDEHMAPN